MASKGMQRQTPEQLAAAHDYRSELWYVRLSEPCRGLFAMRGHELTAVLATLLICERDGILPGGHTIAPTTDPAQSYVGLGVGAEWLIAHEGMMPQLMACVRRNGCHGAYRKVGTERRYEF